MKSRICKDKIYMVKEGVTPQMISDLWPKLLGQVDAREEEADPLVEEDAQEDHQTHQEDRREDHQETTITVTGMIWKGMTRAVT